MTILKRKNQFFPQSFEKLFADDFFTLARSKAYRPSSFYQQAPATNIQKTKDAYVVDIVAPGRKKENFDIQLDKDVLSISIKEETESEGEKGQYTRREFKQREFEQHFTLDLGSLDVENISASYEGGILRLEIPKKAVEAEEETKRRIQIQ